MNFRGASRPGPWRAVRIPLAPALHLSELPVPRGPRCDLWRSRCPAVDDEVRGNLEGLDV